MHYSVHPTGNPHLRNNTGQLAELDLEALKQTTIEDFMSLFRYPKHNRDVLVFPIPNSLGMWFGDSYDFVQIFSRLFQEKRLYVMRARRLRDFFQARSGTYIIIDPERGDNVMIQFKGSPLPPLNLDFKTGPQNPRMRNIFSINLGIQRAFDKIPDSQFSSIEPDEFTLSQWGIQIKAILDQVEVVRWNKGGRERQLGAMIDYFRARR